jgi:hypothetical protein
LLGLNCFSGRIGDSQLVVLFPMLVPLALLIRGGLRTKSRMWNRTSGHRAIPWGPATVRKEEKRDVLRGDVSAVFWHLAIVGLGDE